MNTTIKTIQIPTLAGTEVLDMSDFVEKDQMDEAIDKVCSKIDEITSDLADKIDNIDLTPVENKVDEGVSTLSTKIDNIKLPEIDTTELAKQGENAEATNSAILEEVQAINDKMRVGMAYDKPTGKLTIKGIAIK